MALPKEGDAWGRRLSVCLFYVEINVLRNHYVAQEWRDPVGTLFLTQSNLFLDKNSTVFHPKVQHETHQVFSGIHTRARHRLFRTVYISTSKRRKSIWKTKNENNFLVKVILAKKKKKRKKKWIKISQKFHTRSMIFLS